MESQSLTTPSQEAEDQGSRNANIIVSQSASAQSVVTLEEIVPSHEKIKNKKTKIWKKHASSPKNVRKYYKKQEDLINMINKETDEGFGSPETDQDVSAFAARAAKISLACNILLLIAKAVAAYLSGSLSVISSLVDSAVDLVSGVIIWFTNRSIKMTNFYEYPVGKTRLEPLAITVLSVIMAIASLQLIIESVTSIVKDSVDSNITLPTILIICGTIVIKILLYLYCRGHKSPSIQALQQDHKNDVISNTVALGFGYIGDKVWKPGDPLGAILISLYIAHGWFSIGWQQVKALSGHVATPELLTKLLKVCCTFDSRIQYIDTLRAYHFGNNLIVEVHIVLPPDITLQEAHDIGEPLQQKLTTFSFVERAFVHIDYEYEHRPE